MKTKTESVTVIVYFFFTFLITCISLSIKMASQQLPYIDYILLSPLIFFPLYFFRLLIIK